MTPRFFGYGSLVNLTTHDYPNAAPARLEGWRRIWRPTDIYAHSFLSAHRVEGAEIAGVVADVPGADWAALDAREWGYGRRDVTHLVRHEAGAGPVAVYEVEAPAGDALRPILRSYLDVVVQGFLKIHGEEGAAHFFDTTDNWAVGLLDDRADPKYPRARVLTSTESALVDRLLADHEVPEVRADDLPGAAG